MASYPARLPSAMTSPLARLRGALGERVFYGLIGFVGVLILWETTAQLGLYRKSLLSTPSAIWRVGLADTTSGMIWQHISISMTEFVIGFVVSLAIGIPLGLVIGLFPRVDYLLNGLLAGLNATPNVALIPLIVLLAGIGMESKIVVVFLSAFFAVVVTTFTGVQATARRHLEITRSFGGSQWLAFRSVVLPSTLPFIISGIRIGAGRALVGVVSAEFLSANQGLGFYIALYGQFLDTARVMFGILIFGTLGLAIGEGVRFIERRFEAWRPELHH
ncbi:MAG TPA: ABC transporter permease [Candidatus Limnocylindria bacterium]|nr:ABC transporter permease [Candidatus Limnocylindria bacterium]